MKALAQQLNTDCCVTDSWAARFLGPWQPITCPCLSPHPPAPQRLAAWLAPCWPRRRLRQFLNSSADIVVGFFFFIFDSLTTTGAPENMHCRHGAENMPRLSSVFSGLSYACMWTVRVVLIRNKCDTHLHGNPLQQCVLLDLGNVPNCQTDLKHNTALHHDQCNSSRQHALTVSLDAASVAWNSPAGPLNTLLPHPTPHGELRSLYNS